MSKIVWDRDQDKHYETGTRDTVLFVKGSTGYGIGVAWNGVTGISEKPGGAEANALYADDIKYLELRSAETFGGTIEAYTYPDEWTECDGSRNVIPGMKIGQQTRKSFGLVYTTVKGDGVDFNDAGDLIHIVYNATASPSERAYKSINESPEAVTFSWEFTTTPVDMPSVTIDNETTTFKKSSLITIDTAKFTTTDQQTRLALLKDALYGTDGVGNTDTGTAPTLPTPAQVLGILNGTITSLSVLTG